MGAALSAGCHRLFLELLRALGMVDEHAQKRVCLAGLCVLVETIHLGAVQYMRVRGAKRFWAGPCCLFSCCSWTTICCHRSSAAAIGCMLLLLLLRALLALLVLLVLLTQ